MCVKVELLPVPSGCKVRYLHVFDPTQLKEFAILKKKPPRYATLAAVVSAEDGSLLSMGEAFCSHKDTPSRKRGRMIAHNRAIIALDGRMPHAGA